MFSSFICLIFRDVTINCRFYTDTVLLCTTDMQLARQLRPVIMMHWLNLLPYAVCAMTQVLISTRWGLRLEISVVWLSLDVSVHQKSKISYWAANSIVHNAAWLKAPSVQHWIKQRQQGFQRPKTSQNNFSAFLTLTFKLSLLSSAASWMPSCVGFDS